MVLRNFMFKKTNKWSPSLSTHSVNAIIPHLFGKQQKQNMTWHMTRYSRMMQDCQQWILLHRTANHCYCANNLQIDQYVLNTMNSSPPNNEVTGNGKRWWWLAGGGGYWGEGGGEWEACVKNYCSFCLIMWSVVGTKTYNSDYICFEKKKKFEVCSNINNIIHFHLFKNQSAWLPH